MRIKNSQLEEFAQFLLSLKLRGVENRMRNRFIKIMKRQLEEVQEEHKILLDEYCNKDEKGNFKTIERDGRNYYDIEDVEGFQKQYNLLMEEELILPNDENNEPMLTRVRDIVLSCDREFSGNEAMQYEEFCEIVEDLDLVSNP